MPYRLVSAKIKGPNQIGTMQLGDTTIENEAYGSKLIHQRQWVRKHYAKEYRI